MIDEATVLGLDPDDPVHLEQLTAVQTKRKELPGAAFLPWFSRKA
jgi:hypothetical protein